MSAAEMKSVADRTLAVSAAAAHDMNNDLTVILSGLALALPLVSSDDPARPYLLEVRAAAQRCAWKASDLLNYSARNGARGSKSTLERLIEEGR